MIRVLVAGLGNMGMSHALALHRCSRAAIVGLVNRSLPELGEELKNYRLFNEYHQALRETRPDLVCIATYTDSHAEYALAALNQGAHVFVEKPLAVSLNDAREVVAKAQETGKKLMVGYILRHHPGWQRLISEARALTGPYVFRFNLNQQSTGTSWETHKKLMRTTSPLVDCGVHYVDVMCQIAAGKPVQVSGMGLRLTDEIPPDMYNFGHLQVLFDDGSIGWYEAGWGPMMSETASFIKDIISPQGSVSILDANRSDTDNIEGHTRINLIRVHTLDGQDRDIVLDEEPDHQALCDSEQDFMIRAIEENIDLSAHMQEAVESLRVCLAADQSISDKISITL